MDRPDQTEQNNATTENEGVICACACQERIAELEGKNERLGELLRKRTRDAHACTHLGAIIGPAHSGSFEDCSNQACLDTRAALAPKENHENTQS